MTPTAAELLASARTDAAHDLTAETFAQAWLARGRFRDEAGGSAGPWLFAIARHVLLASVRRRELEQTAARRLGLERSGAAAEPDETWLEGLVPQSLPAGTLALAGTDPECAVVRHDVEYHCVLARPPAPEVDNWKGAVEPMVDASKHVNGGCRSDNAEGTASRCYIGQGAVRQQIIGPGFLGEYAPAPGVG